MTRLFDLLFSVLAIIFFSPIILPVIIVLKLTGEHDIFYKQLRIGQFGKEFELYKFATMLRDSPNLPGGLYTTRNDPRLLPLGSFLRKTKINELPQLINILLGQMSIVGYRPTVREHYNSFNEETRSKIFNLRPGLTGIGSIVFRSEEEILQKCNDKEYFHKNIITPYKGSLESWYSEHRNIYLYFKIIFMTAYVIFKPYSKKWKTSFKNIPPVPEGLENYI